MSKDSKNFYELLTADSAESYCDIFFEIFNCENKETKTIKWSNLYKKINSIRQVLENMLEIEEAECIAVFSNASEETILSVLASYASNITIVFIDNSLTKEEIIEVLKANSVKAVFFPSYLATRVIDIMAPLSNIKHWIITQSSGKSLVPDMKLLSDLVTEIDESKELNIPEIYDDEEALIYVSQGCRSFPIGCSFSQVQIIQMVKAHTELFNKFPREYKHGLFVNEHSLSFILLCYFAPLLSDINICFFENKEIGKFWASIKNSKVNTCLINFTDSLEINKRLKAKEHGMAEDFTFIMITQEVIPEKEISQFCQALQVPVITSFSRVECGGVLTIEEHPNGKPIINQNYISMGQELSDVKVEVATSSGSTLEIGKKGLLKIQSDRVMLSYGGSKPGNDLHISNNILLTEVEGFQDPNHDNNIFIVERGSVIKSIIPTVIPDEPIFETATEVKDEISKSAPQIFEEEEKKYEHADDDTDYGKICVSEIMNLASHVKDAESLLKGAISSLIFHSEFERGLAIEIFRDEKRFTVIANDGFDYLIDSNISIEDEDSLLLKAHGLQNSFATRQNKRTPFNAPNYAFSYLPTQDRGVIAIYCDLPSCNIMPFPERRVFRKVTSILSILIQKFSFRYNN